MQPRWTVEASGLIRPNSGVSAPAAPTGAAVAKQGKSRRVGSAEEIAVTFFHPSPVLRLSHHPDLRFAYDFHRVAAKDRIGAEGSFASGLGKVRSDALRMGFIGTLARRVQG